MKRILAVALVVLFIGVMLNGCGNNSLADYKKAVDKTDQITGGQSSGEFSVTIDFNTEGMAPEDIKELNYYKNISGSFKKSFDRSENKEICRNYINMGGLGFDIDIYLNGEEKFVKLPVIGKYMRMEELIKEIGNSTELQKEMLSDDTMGALSKAWVGMMKEEDIFKGKDIVLTTPDGEVKTKVYTITLNDAQIKSLGEKTIKILSEDETLRSNIDAMLKVHEDESKQTEFDFDQLIEKIKQSMSAETIESHQYTAYVDIDGYIVNEIIEVKITKEAVSAGEPKTIDFYLEINNWDINKDQNFEFPVLTEENTLKTNDLEQTMPTLFKNLLKPE